MCRQSVGHGINSQSIDVVDPTTVIQDTSAESILGALQLRLPWLARAAAGHFLLILKASALHWLLLLSLFKKWLIMIQNGQQQ